MTEKPAWHVERRAGHAAQLHAWNPPDEPARLVRVLEVTAPAIVLGSAQPDETLDGAAVARAGVETARRGSGGGAVLLVPDEHVWIDFWLPGDDPLRTDDVVRGADWAGDAWSFALEALGMGPTLVHRGPQRGDEWARRLCFAGTGPGEVFVRGRKLVGVSQRRTREWLRIQTVVHRRWDAAATVALLAGPAPEPAVLADLQGRVVTVGGHDVAAAVVAQLNR